MADLRISVAAQADLSAIQDVSLTEFGPTVTIAHMAGFERVFGLLRERPMAGPARSDYAPGIRVSGHRPHRIIYRVDGDVVLIVRILHHSRDVRRAIRKTT